MVGYVAELSTPFTNMRWLLKECWQGGTNSRAYLVNGVLMAVVFFGCRVIGMAVLLYMMFVTCEWHPHTYHPRLPACRMVYLHRRFALPFPSRFGVDHSSRSGQVVDLSESESEWQSVGAN